MANQITAHTIMNGSRNLIIQYNIVADGTGDWTDYELLDVTDYTGADVVQPNNFKVVKVAGRNGVGTTFQLKFGNTVGDHKLFFESTRDNEFYEEYEDGGLSTLLADPDMTIRMTTAGFDTDGDNISVTLWLKKKIQNPSS